MPDRLPRDLRALYGLARSAAGASGGPADVLERLCDELREVFGFDRVRLLPGGPLVARALAAGCAVAEGGLAVVPVIVEGRSHGCVAGESAGPLAEADLQLLTALGMLAGVLVEKAEHDVLLARAFEELRRTDQLKSEFVSTASHELREPVAVVFGIASTLHLRGDRIPSDQLRLLRQALYEQSGRLRDLIEQLLDISRIENGSIEVRPQTFRPREWIDLLLPRLAPDRIGDVVVNVDPELELWADPDAFERVVANLIANALRYGRPPVLVSGRGATSFFLAVEDRGDGVPQEFVSDLFDRFTRSDMSRETDRLGAGLGLSIARSFAEALGGTLHYEQADPHGARFVLELPEALRSASRPRASSDTA